MENFDIVFKDITKKYKLLANDRLRLKSLIFPNAKSNLKTALSNVNFKIKQGESVALIGKNGCGKTTLLKIIAKITYPTTGEIKVARRVNPLLFTSAGFERFFTGRENLIIRCSLLGVERKEIDALIDPIIEFSGLGEYIDQQLSKYSAGMVAKLGFSINLLAKPEILLVDEALAVGDMEFINKCQNAISELSKHGTTLIFVSHSEQMARHFCKRGIYLKQGNVIFDGDIDEAYKIYNADINNALT